MSTLPADCWLATHQSWPAGRLYTATLMEKQDWGYALDYIRLVKRGEYSAYNCNE